jgi:chloramphenicol 3-O-phosphotransferase
LLFDCQDDWDYLDEIFKIFTDVGGEVYVVELEASLEVRLERNKTPHRLSHKPSKRDFNFSESQLKDTMKNYRPNSYDGEVKSNNYLKIDNTQLEPAEVARQIKETFDF